MGCLASQIPLLPSFVQAQFPHQWDGWEWYYWEAASSAGEGMSFRNDSWDQDLQPIVHGPNPALYLILCGLRAKNGACNFQEFEQIKRIILCGTWKWYEIRILMSIKLYWETALLVCLYCACHWAAGENQGPASRCPADTFTKGPGQDRGWGHEVKTPKLGLGGTSAEASEKQARGRRERFSKILQVPDSTPPKGWLKGTSTSFPSTKEETEVPSG